MSAPCCARAWLSAIPWEHLRPDAIGYDLKYATDSPFLSIVRAAGRPTASGLGMLLWQGVLAFERWTGLAAPVAAMRSALNEAAERRWGS